jgi:hypothetical protein
MSKHVRTAPAGAKIQPTLTLAHPRGLPVLLHPDGSVFTCDPLPAGRTEHFRIGTYDKQSDNLSLELAEDIATAVAQWRANQKPRGRTERVTEYRAFLKKSKAAVSKQAGTGGAAAAEDNSD